MCLRSIYQVYHHILIECGPPFCRNPAHIHHSFWIVSVDMEDWCVDHTSHVCRVGRGTCHSGIRSESNLATTDNIHQSNAYRKVRGYVFAGKHILISTSLNFLGQF